MVNAQNLKYPQVRLDLSQLSPLYDPVREQVSRDFGFQGLGALPDAPPRAQKNNALQEILNGLEGGLATQEAGVQGISADKDSLANQILAGYNNQPKETPRKRVPRDTQLLTGGIGLLLRALGASHEATMGGVGTALSGMQQKLDEEVEAENTKKFREYEAIMKGLGFQYQHLKDKYGEESEEAKTMRGQIDNLRKRVDKELDDKRQIVLDATKRLEGLITDKKLLPSTLKSIIDTGRAFGVDVITNEKYYEYLYDAEQNAKRMTANEMREQEKGDIELKLKRDDLVQSGRQNEMDALDLDIKRLEKAFKEATQGDRIAAARAGRELSEQQAIRAKKIADNTPTEIALENQRKRQLIAKGWASLDDAANVPSGDDAKIVSLMDQAVRSLLSTLPSNEAAKKRGESGRADDKMQSLASDAGKAEYIRQIKMHLDRISDPALKKKKELEYFQMGIIEDRRMVSRPG